MPPRAILFDLDGTLVQTRDASWQLFSRINQSFGLGIDTQEKFFGLLEDNMFQGLRDHCGDDRKAEAAANQFLSLLQTDYNPEFVPGMSDVVKAFAGNCSLSVVSSNTIATIRRILTQENIAHCFSHVFSGDVERDKRASVRRFLTDRSYAVSRDCTPAYCETHQPSVPTANQIVLITDTVGDVKHARECGIRAVGVAWGMHSEAQLLAAGAEIVALWPQELVAHLLPGGFAAAACGLAPPAADHACGCGCDGPSDQAGCDCHTDELARAGAIRRQRSIAAAAGLARRVGGSGDAPAPVPARAMALPKRDMTLLNSLARLRGANRNGTHPPFRST